MKLSKVLAGAAICSIIALSGGVIIAQNYKEFSITQLEQAANEKKPEAQLELGLRYLNGEGGVGFNIKEAEKWIKKAADQNNAVAQYQLGMLYYNFSEQNGRDYNKAFKYFEKSAKQGDAKACYMLGLCYYYGRGEKADPARGLVWIKKAANASVPSAQYFMGYACEEGLPGVSKSAEEAAKWYHKAGMNQYKDAYYKLGVCYDEGLGVERNPNEAERYFMAAAKASDDVYKNNPNDPMIGLKVLTAYLEKDANSGDPHAQLRYGNVLYYGIDRPQDQRQGIEWIRKAAAQGLVPAQAKLGNYLHYGQLLPTMQQIEDLLNAETVDSQAVKLWGEAAREGDILSEMNTAFYNLRQYDGDNGMAPVIRENVALLKKAADKGQPLAQYYVGLCYNAGIGTAENHTETERYLKLAANQGFAPAQAALGVLYISSDWLSNEQEGVRLSKLASEQGNLQATRTLVDYYLSKDNYDEAYHYMKQYGQLTGEPYGAAFAFRVGFDYYINHEFPEALRWFNEAYNGGESYGAFMLGICNFNGEGIFQSNKRAFEYWEKGARKDHYPSIYYLAVCHDLGKGVEKNAQEAEKLYSRAAVLAQELDDFYALPAMAEENDSVAVAYTYDSGTSPYYADEYVGDDDSIMYPANETAADSLYEEDVIGGDLVLLNYEKAKGGDPLSQYNMGNFYYYGIEVPASVARALEWYQRAAAQGFQPAVLRLEQIRRDKS